MNSRLVLRRYHELYQWDIVVDLGCSQSARDVAPEFAPLWANHQDVGHTKDTSSSILGHTLN